MSKVLASKHMCVAWCLTKWSSNVNCSKLLMHVKGFSIQTHECVTNPKYHFMCCHWQFLTHFLIAGETTHSLKCGKGTRRCENGDSSQLLKIWHYSDCKKEQSWKTWPRKWKATHFSLGLGFPTLTIDTKWGGQAFCQRFWHPNTWMWDIL